MEDGVLPHTIRRPRRHLATRRRARRATNEDRPHCGIPARTCTRRNQHRRLLSRGGHSAGEERDRLRDGCRGATQCECRSARADFDGSRRDARRDLSSRRSRLDRRTYPSLICAFRKRDGARTGISRATAAGRATPGRARGPHDRSRRGGRRRARGNRAPGRDGRRRNRGGGSKRADRRRGRFEPLRDRALSTAGADAGAARGRPRRRDGAHSDGGARVEARRRARASAQERR